MVLSSAVAGHKAHFPSLRIFSASQPMISLSPSYVSVLPQSHPLRHFPRLSSFQPAHLFEKTFSSINRRRQAGGLIECSINKLAETEAISLEENPRRLAEKLPPATGVYAMHDKNGELQYIGISRMVSNSVLSHLRDVPELCGSVKIAIVEYGRIGLNLTNAWKLWMDEHIEYTCKVPLGNEAWNNTWKKKETSIKANLRLKDNCYDKWMMPLEQAIKKLIHENEVLAFIKGSRITPLCPLSYKVLAILSEQMVYYETIDVFDEVYNPGLGKALKAYTHFPAIPQIFIHGNFIGGVDDLDEMANKGELYKLFLQQRFAKPKGKYDGQSERDYDAQKEDYVVEIAKEQ